MERALNFITTGIQAFYQNILSHYEIVSWPKDFRINKKAFETARKNLRSFDRYGFWYVWVVYMLGKKGKKTQLHIQIYACVFEWTFPWDSIRKNTNYSIRCLHKDRMIINFSGRIQIYIHTKAT